MPFQIFKSLQFLTLSLFCPDSKIGLHSALLPPHSQVRRAHVHPQFSFNPLSVLGEDGKDISVQFAVTPLSAMVLNFCVLPSPPHSALKPSC